MVLKGHSHVSKGNPVVVKTVEGKFRFSVSLKFGVKAALRKQSLRTGQAVSDNGNW